MARAGAGIDNIDEAALAAASVVLVNAPEGNRDAVGEFATGQLLALLRHTVTADAEVRRAEWHREANRGEELGTKTVGMHRLRPHGPGVCAAPARLRLHRAGV